MKKSITSKIESLLNAMVNGSSSETIRDIMRRPTNENKSTEKKANSFSYKFIQLLR